jgi:hypothetical protein
MDPLLEPHAISLKNIVGSLLVLQAFKFDPQCNLRILLADIMHYILHLRDCLTLWLRVRLIPHQVLDVEVDSNVLGRVLIMGVCERLKLNMSIAFGLRKSIGTESMTIGIHEI